jgi:hypothetical protein
MSNFELGYCSLDEYHAGAPNRIMESSMAISGLYTAMFSLDSPEPWQAFKYPCRITDIERLDSGLSKVRFTFLNADLTPDYDTHGAFYDGF